MAFIPVANTVMAELRMRLDGQRVENTLYFRKLGGWDVTAMNALGNDLLTWWAANIAPEVTNAVTLVEVYLTDLATATSPTASVTPLTPTPGSIASDPVPNNVAFVISFRTAGRGRSSRGRNYIAGLDEEDVTTNTLNNTRRDNLVAAYNDLLTVAASNDADWVVVSRFANGVPRVSGLVQPVQVALSVDSTVDSQRRRLPGRGT